MNVKEYLIILFVIGFSFFACSNRDATSNRFEDDPPRYRVNMNIATSGQYPATSEKIYVDENFNATSQQKARYYLEKELLGRELIPNDQIRYDYWKDKKYFKDTPVIMYIYHYYDVKDGKLFFAANVNELEGTTQYLFHGKAFWAYKNDKVKLSGHYSLGKPDGEFVLYNEDGTVKEKYGYEEGKKYTNTQKTEDIFKPLVGHWEGELQNDADFKLETQVYDLKADGTMEFYHNIYYNTSSGTPNWEITDYGNDTKATGSWKYIPNSETSGVMEFYYKGKLVQKADIRPVNEKEMMIKVTFIDTMFNQDYMDKELRFHKKVN